MKQTFFPRYRGINLDGMFCTPASCYADGAYDVLTSGTNGRIADPENPEAFAACLDGMLSKPLPAALPEPAL